MNKKRIEKLWMGYRYRVDRTRFDFQNHGAPEEVVALLGALLDNEEHIAAPDESATLDT